MTHGFLPLVIRYGMKESRDIMHPNNKWEFVGIFSMTTITTGSFEGDHKGNTRSFSMDL